jgi:hypothetical protein
MPVPVAGKSFTVVALVTNPAYVPTPTGSVQFDFGDGTPAVTVALDYRTASTTHTYSAVDPANVTATYSGDSSFGPASTTLQGQIVRSVPNMALNVFGDSISTASNDIVPNGANWVTMTAWAEGFSSLNDMAVPGYKVADETPFIYGTKVAANTYSAVLLGQNDFNLYSVTDPNYITQYISSLLAVTEWLLIPEIDANGMHPKFSAQDLSVTRAGTWTQSSLYPSIGLGTTEAGDSLTATITGATAYLGLSTTPAGNYTIDVFVDGALQGEYSPSIVYSGATTTSIPWGVRIALPGSSLSDSHTVTAVCKTPGTSGCFVDWFGGNGFVAPNKLPLLWLGEPYHTNQTGRTYQETQAYISAIRQIGQDLQSDGLGVTLADVFDNFDGARESACLVDQVHPAKCGHQVIAATFLGAMNWLFTKDQRIDLGTQTSANFSSTPIPIDASATSSLPVTLTLLSGNAVLENNALRVLSTGSVTLEADQGGDSNYRPAAPEQKTIQILPAPVTVSVAPASTQVILPGSTSVSVHLTWTGTTPVPGSVTLYDGSQTIGTAQLDGTGAATIANLQFSPGTHTLTAQYAQQGNFAAGVSAAVSVEVVKATPSISWATPPAITYGTGLGANQLNATSPVAGTFAYTPAAGTVLNAGSRTLSATFTPTDATNYATATQTVQLTVNQAAPTITWATPAAINYATALSATQLNASSPVAGTFTYTPAVGSVLSAGKQTLSVTFTPTDTTNYTTTTSSVTLTVNQATPTISWATPSAISFGTALGANQLNATSPVAGTFSYAPSAGVVLTAGTRTLSVTFTPTDTTNYTAANSSVSLTVNPVSPSLSLTCTEVVYDGNAHSCSGSATDLHGTVVNGTWSMSPATETAVGSYTVSGTFTSSDSNYAGGTASGTLKIDQAKPAINWATPPAITYGTGLGANQLNATSPVAGTFAYTPAAGTVLSAGSHLITATFAPTDTQNYSAADASVTLIVNKVTPTITWNSPAAIIFGTSLSATQLNATASVPGTFVYNPSAGETPPVGDNTLIVTFTPTDATNFASATASVILTVKNPLPVMSGISPAIANAGGAPFQLSITGAGFVPSSTVFWGATALSTQYVSGSQLTAQMPASGIAGAGVTAISVQSPTPGGGTSGSLQFEVDSAAAANAPLFSAAAVTVTAGSTASYPVTLPSSATNVSATCLNLPPGATCSYSSATRTVSITTSSTTPMGTYQVTVVFTETWPGAAAGFVFLPVLLLPLLFIRKKLTARGAWFTACLGIVLLAGTIAGCGGSATPTPNPTHQVTSSGSVRLIVQ